MVYMYFQPSVKEGTGSGSGYDEVARRYTSIVERLMA